MSTELSDDGIVLDCVFRIEIHSENGQKKIWKYQFSQKYLYTCDEKENAITISRMRNANYIEHFFGENIEVNAVVGENGAGKTQLLRSIFESMIPIMYNTNPLTDSKESVLAFILVFQNREAYYIYLNDGEPTWKKCLINDASIQSEINTTQTANHIPAIYYHSLTLDYGTFSGGENLYYRLANAVRKGNQESKIADNGKQQLHLSFYDLSTSALLSDKNLSGHNRFGVNTVNEYFHEDFYKQILFVNEYCKTNSDEFRHTLGFDIPHELCVTIVSDKEIAEKLTQSLELEIDLETIKKKKAESNSVPDDKGSDEISERILKNPSIMNRHIDTINALYDSSELFNKLKAAHSGVAYQEWLAWGILANALFLYSNHPAVNAPGVKKSAGYRLRELYMQLYEMKFSNELSTWEKLDLYIKELDSSPVPNINTSKISDKKKWKEQKEKWEHSRKSLKSFVNLLNQAQSNAQTPIPEIILKKGDHKQRLAADLNKFFKCYKNFSGYLDFLHFSWPLSSGEVGKLDLFARLYSAFSKKKESHVILLLDEADMLLHPRWQQNYVASMVNLSKQMINKKYANSVQIIVATHSPIMLSDIPKQNTLFLPGKSLKEQGSNEETFAANIYSLYNRSFFLEEGCVGSFAAQVIQDLTEKIEDYKPENDKWIEERLTIIGDKFMRSFLTREYLKQKRNYNSEQSMTELELIQRVHQLEKENQRLSKENANLKGT